MNESQRKISVKVVHQGLDSSDMALTPDPVEPTEMAYR